jgi:tetratricopeptide (TPR) repeat protein/transcriptional regulator with XRE-family HTH domain
MKEPPKDFADQLGYYLVRAGFTQQELAHKIGMHRNTVVKWMNRTSKPTSRGQVLRIADELSLVKEERKALLQAARFSVEQWPTELWTVPHQRDMFFTGREGIFRSLRALLIPGSTTALTQAISGLGGIGKTHTAVEYAYRFHRDYEAVLWLQADSWETLVSACVQLANELALPDQKEADQVIAEVQRWLRKHRSWLLILDNVEHPQEILSRFVPTQHHGSVLLTTRVHDVEPLAQTQVLATMSEDEGILFLLRRTKKVAAKAGLDQAGAAQQGEARQIWQLMDGLPLALDQAGAYILETSCSFAEYREQYVRRRAELLARRGKRFISHEASVATTFSLAFERVEALNPAAADLLRACALLASEAIPEEIFREGAPHLGPLLAAGGASWDLAIGVLHDYSLVQRSAEAQTLAIHRLVQAVLRDTMDTPTFRLWANRVVQAVEAVLPGVEHHTAARFERLLAHALNCAGLVEQCHLTSRAATQLLYQTGVYLAEHARYAEAGTLYLQCLHLRERVLEPWHPDVAYPLYALAELYREQGKYGEAAPLYQRTIRIWRQALDPDNPELAYPLRGLAELYHMQGNYDGAAPLYQQALQISEQALGLEHRELAGLLSCLANLYREQGKYGEAEALYQRVLRIDEHSDNETHTAGSSALQGLAELYSDQGRYGEAEVLYQRALHNFEQVLDPDHPRIAPLLHNLANVYVDEGKFHEAELLYKRAIRIREQALGPEHHQLAHALSSLANIYLEQENYPEAELLYGRALRIYELAVGPTNAQVAAPLNNLGRLYQKQGKYGEADALCLRALHIREHALGPEHRDVATSLDYIAQLYCEQGKYGEAEPLYKRALRIREQALGSDHPELVFPLNGLGNIYCEQGRYQEAEPLYRRALSLWDQRQDVPPSQLVTLLIYLARCYREQRKYGEAEPLYQRALYMQEQALGPDSPQLVPMLNSLANLYHLQANYPEAEPLYQRALRIQEQVSGRDHPDVADQLNGLAGLYADQEKYGEAEPLYHRALRIQEQVLGQEHPDVAATLNNLAELYRVQGKYGEAKQLHQRALHIREQALGPEHPEVAKSLTNLAVLYSVQGNYLEAELLVMRALEIVERILGPQHSQTQASHRFYGAILRAMGREEEAKLEEARSQGQERAGSQTLQQEHALQYQLVHERLSDLVERAADNIKGMCSQILQEWEEAVLAESQTDEAFALYGLPPKTISQLVPENRVHEGRNPRLWTGEGSERIKESLYVIDVDQNPFEVALDEGDSYSWPLPLNMALRQAFDVTDQRFFREGGGMKQPDNPECRRIYRGILAAALALAKRGERE